MEEEKGKCYRCIFFDRYYTKETKHFQRTSCGMCRKKSENVFACGVCDYYSQRQGGYRSRLVIKRCLHELLIEISEVRKMLEVDNYNEDDC